MRYNLLGKTGVYVSELCLGTMTFGGKGFWEVIGKQGQPVVNDLVKTALDHGINFIDTADVYSTGESEILLGNALRQPGTNRNEIILATKVRERMSDNVNALGLSRLHILQAVDASLKRLQTDHIDLYQIHGFDLLTPLEETMRALEDVVRAGKVRYIGCCNLAAWQVVKANAISDKYGWTKFVSTQNYYAIVGRDIEREIVPVAEDEQLAILPWSPLAGGFLSGKFTKANPKPENSRRSDFDFPPIDKEKAYRLIDEMQTIAETHQCSVATVALAWMLSKKFVTSIIIGAKDKNQLLENIKSTEVQLTAEQVRRLDEASALPVEYPQWMLTYQTTGRAPQATPSER
ncbi:MAG: aldo/keto reductase [Rhizobacter sp.]|nr:aldo/keto reductase [Chlorobiales bacterium]